MKKNILVTGSEGYIGAIVIPMLKSKGYNPIGLDTCFFQEANINKYSFPHYILIKKDIRDIDYPLLEELNLYGVIHLAALSNDPLGMINENLTYDINHKASVKLAEMAKKAKVQRFIYASSCSLYGQGKADALTEESLSNPQTAYGKSKILAEQDIRHLANENFSPVYMRNATAFGFSPRHRFDIVVNNLAGFAKVDREIKILGDGTPWRPIVHIKDISNAMIKALEAPKDNIHNQVFNVGSNRQNYQIKDIARKIQDTFHGCQIMIAQKDAGDTRDYNVAFDKLNNVLGYNTSWGLEMGIKELYNNYQDISLNKTIFESRLYTRLKQLLYLVENKILDENFREL